MKRGQFPIHNGTLKTFNCSSSREVFLFKHIETRLSSFKTQLYGSVWTQTADLLLAQLEKRSAGLRFQIFKSKFLFWYFWNMQQLANKVFSNLKRSSRLIGIFPISLISQSFKGYRCESEIALFAWRFTLRLQSGWLICDFF